MLKVTDIVPTPDNVWVFLEDGGEHNFVMKLTPRQAIEISNRLSSAVYDAHIPKKEND